MKYNNAVAGYNQTNIGLKQWAINDIVYLYK